MFSEIFEYIKDLLIMNFLFLKPERKFLYKNQKLNYFYHKYNKTWKNERAIEISVAIQKLRNYKDKHILEVGNVLKHYIKLNHEVLDKYEEGKDIIHEDIVNFTPSKKYDLILSISTIEHVGIDDVPKAPIKAIDALKKMQSMLKKDGMLFVSFPLNYNSALSLLMEKIKKNNIICFKKVNSSKNIWQEAEYSSVKNIPYSQPVKVVAFLEIPQKYTLN